MERPTRPTDLLGPRHPVAAAAVVRGDEISTDVKGADPQADFEIGSVSKGLTGLLYADALERDEASAATTLGELLPLDGAVGRVTLGALATHSSGLPRLPPAAHPLRRTVNLWRHGTNPYGETLDELLDQARSVRRLRSRPAYSNLGFQLLGHAVARAAGTSYVTLLEERLAAPLGLGLYAPAAASELRRSALRGRTAGGRGRDPWTGEALAPAGGVRATIGDMAALTAAMLTGVAPGMAALEPTTQLGMGARIGAGWITVARKGGSITWHNGGTGGFRSWLGLDRAAGVGVVVLSATARSVDRHGFALLEQATTS